MSSGEIGASASRLPLRPVRPVQGQHAYRVSHHPAPIDLDLSANEGSAVDVALLAAQLPASALRSYPRAADLEARLAARLGVPHEHLLVCAGGDDALARAIRSVGESGAEVILPLPTFEMLPRYVALSGATAVELPWPPGAEFPQDAVLQSANERTRALCVVSPNNPTGAVIAPAALDALCRALPHVLVIVDLAYEEFADFDLSAVALRHSNALVVRTLSKAWGLAGLRVGYAIGAPEVIGWLRTVGQPFAVSGPSLALAALALDRVDVAPYVAEVKRERARLVEQLIGLGQGVWPSQGNFVLGRFERAEWLYQALASLGIRVRFFADHPDLNECVRISCPGDPTAFSRLERGLATALAPQALLFDMDGVLADVSASYREAIRLTAASYGVAVDGAAMAAAKQAGDANDDWRLTQRLVAASCGEAPALEEVTERFESYYQGSAGGPGLWQQEALIPSLSLLRRLAARYPLAVVTGRPRADAERFLRSHELEALFRVVICREDAPLKPDPRAVQLALQRLGVARAWMIGDTADDLRAAHGAGAVGIGFIAPGDETSHEALLAQGAARVLQRFEQLEELLP